MYQIYSCISRKQPNSLSQPFPLSFSSSLFWALEDGPMFCTGLTGQDPRISWSQELASKLSYRLYKVQVDLVPGGRGCSVFVLWQGNPNSNKSFTLFQSTGGVRGEWASGCMILTCQLGLTHNSSYLIVSFHTPHLFFPVLKYMEMDCFGRKMLSGQYEL